ncbi:chitin synthase-domain-containing protein [Linnemannia elongata]|nr:chitin synthase-domain-containing protein [Linnemannia elongata]
MALLIEQGASLNILDQYGWSSLMLAAYAGKLDACKLLLAQGADPHIKTANGKNARSLSWDAGHKSIAVYITRYLSREGSSGGGTSSIMSTASGPGSSMSTRTLIQQMLPPAPRSPSRRTHSPAPSLPSVPEEAQEEDHYRPRRSFSGYNSTISRHSGLSSRLSAPPKARRHQSLPAVPVPPQPTDTAPSLPPLPTIGQDLSAIFIEPKDDLPSSILEASPVDEAAAPSKIQNQDDNVEEPTSTSLAVKEPAIPEKSRPRISWRSSTSSRIYSVHRRGLIPRYGTKHVRYYTESSLENTDPIINRSGSNYHQRRVRLQRRSSNSLAERAKEKGMESDINRRIREHMHLIERNRNHIWVTLSNLWTACCPAKALPKSWSADRQQDWREKVTLCSLVTSLTILFGFLAFGLALLTCRPHSMELLSTSEFAMRYGSNSENFGHLATIRGAVYDMGSFFAQGSHPSSASGGATSAAINSYLTAHYGDDMSALFPPPDLSGTCRLFGAITNFGKCSGNNTAINYCHSFEPASNDVLRQFERNDVVITYPWSDIADSTSRYLFVYDGSVFDATDYLAQVPGPTISAPEISRMYWIRSLIGRDATLAVRKQADYRDIARCFQAYFKVGVLSGEPAGGCLASLVINTFSLAILLVITFMRLVSALVYWFVFSQPTRTESGKASSGLTTRAAGNKTNNSADSGDSIDTENHVLMLVTCQATDQDDQIRSTLDSLALTDHDDGRKLLLVMADATWDVDGERSQASLACLRLMQPSTPIESEKPSQSLLSDDPFSEDIYSGYYVVDSRRVPYVLVLRAPDQDLVQEKYVTWWKKKMILRWLYRICFNEPISSFEYALFERVRWLMGGGSGPDVFEMLLVAEVGVECDRRSLSRMVGTLRRNEKVMGVCAQRVISNATENWLTRVQDYENHLSFQFTSAFESTLSAVQCLSSRFSLVRIKLRCHQGSHYPGHVKLDKRNSDETSVFSETDDDDEIMAEVNGEEGRDLELGEADGDVDGGTAEGHQDSTKRIKRQRLLKKIMASEDVQYSFPILIHPDVVSCFVGNKARTLHERSLLLQGAEDRYLTGLLHQTFPDRRIVYVPQAVYRSRVTPALRSFLQEQGRLLASSFHALWRQIWISQLRGRFCCSLNFLALIEWLSLVILPSAVFFSIVLLVIVAVGAAEKVGALDALPVILALCFMMAIVALQPLLGVCLGGGERTLARNLYGVALFLVLLPFKTLALALYVCFHPTEAIGVSSAESGKETPRKSERRLRHWAEWHTMRRGSKVQNQSQSPTRNQSPSQSLRRHTSLSRVGGASSGSGVGSPGSPSKLSL